MKIFSGKDLRDIKMIYTFDSSTARQMKYNLIHFGKCPTFAMIHQVAKEFFVVKTCEDGQYAIIIELVGNGKINYGII